MEKFLNRIVWLFMIVPAIYLAIVWNTLPETVAVHFDISGKPDRFGSKSELLIMVIILSVMCPVLYLILSNIYRIDPKKYAADNKFRLRRLAFGVVVFFVAVLCMIIYSSSKGSISFNTGIILSATGLFFAFIGNYMHNIKPNYFAGFRLPWALENEENWKKTHALAGKLWFGGGLLLAATCSFLSPRAAMAVFTTVMIIITAIPILFSFLFYRSKKNNANNK